MLSDGHSDASEVEFYSLQGSALRDFAKYSNYGFHGNRKSDSQRPVWSLHFKFGDHGITNEIIPSRRISTYFIPIAYFTGAQEPYEKLKRALRADIDEGAWSALYSTISQPFPRPTTGSIAVKVINHYGDEVLKVYPIK